MDLEEIREYCLGKKAVTESLPFNEDIPVYKVADKIFLLANLIPPLSINVKCDPERAVELREKYSAITPGYHMNKSHWNTIELNGTIATQLMKELIDHSYELVVGSLPKKTILNCKL